MNENLQVFQHEQFGSIRTLNENGTVLFCGSDVAKALGYAKPPKSSFRPLQGGNKVLHPYQMWRKAPAFRHGDISHTLFPRNGTERA